MSKIRAEKVRADNSEVLRRREELSAAVAGLRGVVPKRAGARFGRFVLPVVAGATAFVIAQAWRRRRG